MTAPRRHVLGVNYVAVMVAAAQGDMAGECLNCGKTWTYRLHGCAADVLVIGPDGQGLRQCIACAITFLAELLRAIPWDEEPDMIPF